MRGYPQFNFPAFFKAAGALEEEGFEVFNPAARDVAKYGDAIYLGNDTGSTDVATKSVGFSLREALAADLAWICEHADAIALLPGWEKSKGACAEKALAEALNLVILEVTDQ